MNRMQSVSNLKLKLQTYLTESAVYLTNIQATSGKDYVTHCVLFNVP